MGYEVLNDQLIHELLSLSKRVKNPSARGSYKYKHKQTDYLVEDESGGYHFTLYLRQNSIIEDDFSCGLAWNMPSGETVTLIRYNGSSHSHPNHLENERLGYICHIHKATERYALAGKKPDGYATDAQTKYQTLKGALHCLLTDCHIQGLTSAPDEPDLFP